MIPSYKDNKLDLTTFSAGRVIRTLLWSGFIICTAVKAPTAIANFWSHDVEKGAAIVKRDSSIQKNTVENFKDVKSKPELK